MRLASLFPVKIIFFIYFSGLSSGLSTVVGGTVILYDVNKQAIRIDPRPDKRVDTWQDLVDDDVEV